ncbi:MAG: hypothetical protein H7Z12_11170 [Rhodospirillaceae bacterium]|nr:hypothetical protein [Rhodospirillales bacterium]
MRLVFVNYCHPATPHICGVRVSHFASAMAARGHQVVLITRDLDGQPSAPPPADLAARLAGHDWAQPFHLAVAPKPSALFDRLQAGSLPGGLRQLAILGAYLGAGGIFADWRAACRPYAKALAVAFRPQLAWGTFGNTDSWAVARDMAGAAQAPWVGDIKDYWRMFIPAPLRRVLAWRFRDAAHLTLLAGTHVDEARPYFPHAATVIYSGMPELFLEPAAPPAAAPFTLVLSGSLYDQPVLEDFLGTLAAWGQGRGARLIYAGADYARMARTCEAMEVGRHWQMDIHPYLPLEDLRALQLAASANAYMRSARCFHHKVIELLSMRRPVISFPGEGAEAQAIAEATGGTLLSCWDGAQLRAALDRLAAGEDFSAATAEGLARYTWAAQAETLEACFAGVLS